MKLVGLTSSAYWVLTITVQKESTPQRTFISDEEVEELANSFENDLFLNKRKSIN